jgi:hypothetical protein
VRRSFQIIAWMTAIGLSGCGNALYVSRVLRASDEVARAEQLDAAREAPYEYFYAVEHLRKARSEAVDGDYSDAALLAETAYRYAGQAIQRAQRVAPIVTPREGLPGTTPAEPLERP